MKKWTVIVYPAEPERALSDMVSTVGYPIRVTDIHARHPQEAADKVELKPGEHCTVVIEGRYFSRAQIAPLEERDSRGAALPECVPMEA